MLLGQKCRQSAMALYKRQASTHLELVEMESRVLQVV